MRREFLELPLLARAQGEVALPGSKSISNRTLLLAALSQGVTHVSNLLQADDTRVMLEALQTLGIQLERLNPHEVIVHGCGGVFPVAQADLFLGNAGTAIRPLTAALAASAAVQPASYRLSGVARMHERPIGDLVNGLTQLGAHIRYLQTPGYPPLVIESAPLKAAHIRVRGDTSSQFLTALLMAAPLVAREQPMTLEVDGELISKPYIDITINLMQRFGVTVQRDGWRRFYVPAGQNYQAPGHIQVEGDASSASYFLAAGALAGGPVRITGAGRRSIQGDVKFADALAQMGAHVVWGDDWIEAWRTGPLRSMDLDCNAIPDAAMTLAVCALYAQGETTLRNIASWRVKETDRIKAMATELRKLGAKVEEGTDFIRISPPRVWHTASIHTYDDHRMAMCFSLAAFATPVCILDPDCVAKTYPDYFAVFASLTAQARS